MKDTDRVDVGYALELLTFARLTLTEHWRAGRENGRPLPPELEALTLLLMRFSANRCQPLPAFDGDEESGEVLAVTYEQAGRRLNVSARSIARLVADGRIPTVSLGGSRRISVRELRALVDSSERRNRMRSGRELPRADAESEETG